MYERSHEAAEAMEALVGLLAERLAPLLAREISSEPSECPEEPRAAEWMDHTECAEYLRTTRHALYKQPIPHHKLGGRRLYSRAEVDAAVRDL
jgi:hypothetical protein